MLSCAAVATAVCSSPALVPQRPAGSSHVIPCPTLWGSVPTPVQWGVWSQGRVMFLLVLSFLGSRCLQGPPKLERLLFPEGPALVSTPFTAPRTESGGVACKPSHQGLRQEPEGCTTSLGSWQGLEKLFFAGCSWRTIREVGFSQLGGVGAGLGGWRRTEGLNTTEPNPTAAGSASGEGAFLRRERQA